MQVKKGEYKKRMNNIYSKIPLFLILTVLIITSLLWEYIKFKLELKNVIKSEFKDNRELFIRDDWNINLKIHIYYIIIFLILHFITIYIIKK